jgi:hypothetical protein
MRAVVQFEYPQICQFDNLWETVRMAKEKFTPKNGQIVLAQGNTGTFKVLAVSADGLTADIQSFHLSRVWVPSLLPSLDRCPRSQQAEHAIHLSSELLSRLDAGGMGRSFRVGSEGGRLSGSRSLDRG